MIGALTLWAPVAVAAPLTIASLTADVPISAYGGWVVWSVPVPGGWGLNAWHAGVVTALPIAARPDPFDVDVGTDADLKVVVTFSRCSTNPKNTSFPVHIAPWTGDDCGTQVVDLATGVERHGGQPRPEGASDTTPSMWHGRIAFGRHYADFGEVQQVELWTPPSDSTVTLRHGSVPTSCPFKGGCRGLLHRGAVQGLDLGPRLVTFLWWVDAPGVAGQGGWEVRADRLSNGRSVLAGSGNLGEACTGDRDLVAPSAPVAVGYDVWYSAFASACYADDVTLVHFRTRTRQGIGAATPGEVIEFAADGTSSYALLAPKPPAEVRPTCTTDAPCTLQRIDAPAPFAHLPRPRPPRS